MPILSHIHSSADVKKLNYKEMDTLCCEIRQFLITHIAKTGGHLASNLGIVEIAVALHKVFDTGRDRIVFDVGHQSYPHKIITGRRDGFDKLRTLGNLSGFPKPSESYDDAFATGHASTSISAALGLARARTLQRQDFDVVAVIGDGSLTGGLAYEALNDAGQSGEPIIVIVNDNGMSITKNVGGVAEHLSHLRVKPQYLSFKKTYHDLIDPLPGSARFESAVRGVKNSVKNALLPGSMFEQMGFYYMGPVDGHDVATLSRLLLDAREMRCPVLIHVITKKGKGYRPSEQNPEAFHGISQFDILSGQTSQAESTFSNRFGQSMIQIARTNPKLCAITAAMPAGTGLSAFADTFPERYFDVGIAEEHAVTMAAGLAAQAMRPVVAIYSTFLQRSYDQLIHDVALTRQNVVLAVDRAGLVGEDGETHQGVFDVPFLSTIPHLTLYAPASFPELDHCLKTAVNRDIPTECVGSSNLHGTSSQGSSVTLAPGPVAVRYPRGGETGYQECHTEPVTVLCEGRDVTLLTYGIQTSDCLRAAEQLAKRGIEVRVVKLMQIAPLPESLWGLLNGRLLVVEDCISEGCVGQRIAAGILERSLKVDQFKLHNLGLQFLPHGSVDDLKQLYGMDADGIATAARRMLGENCEETED